MKFTLIQLSLIFSILFGSLSCSRITYGTELPPYQTSICGLEVTEIEKELPSLPFQAEPRFLVFISDLHMGVGKYLKKGKTDWHEEEDFRWAGEFVKFLEKINQEGKGTTDLILNGDTFELWQSTLSNCDNGKFGCTEKEALERIRIIISQHTPTLQAIGGFANQGNNRVIIIPGNHDAALLYPAVGAEVLKGIPHKAGRVSLAKEGFWLSSNGLVYAEHGHQIGRELNCFRGWPVPFVQGRGKKFLERPWGEQFVIDYYSPFEKKYPIIDNIAKEADGLRYGLKTEDNLNIVRQAGKFVKFFFLDVSWDQFKQVLTSKEGDSPQWDVPYIRKNFDNQFVL